MKKVDLQKLFYKKYISKISATTLTGINQDVYSNYGYQAQTTNSQSIKRFKL